jgi:hypothetical protein
LIVEGSKWRVCAPCDGDGDTFIEGMTGNEETQRDKLIALLDRVANHRDGPRSIPSDRNHLVDSQAKLWQFRVDQFRVIWFYDEGFMVVCAHLYVKQKAKAPPAEIASAKRVKEAYLAAKRAGTLRLRKP